MQQWTATCYCGVPSCFLGTVQSFKDVASRPSPLQVGSDDEGYAVRLRLQYFWEYCDHPDHGRVDDSPLYIFDGE
jgi:hypothetical protein